MHAPTAIAASNVSLIIAGVSQLKNKIIYTTYLKCVDQKKAALLRECLLETPDWASITKLLRLLRNRRESSFVHSVVALHVGGEVLNIQPSNTVFVSEVGMWFSHIDKDGVAVEVFAKLDAICDEISVQQSMARLQPCDILFRSHDEAEAFVADTRRKVGSFASMDEMPRLTMLKIKSFEDSKKSSTWKAKKLLKTQQRARTAPFTVPSRRSEYVDLSTPPKSQQRASTAPFASPPRMLEFVNLVTPPTLPNRIVPETPGIREKGLGAEGMGGSEGSDDGGEG
jgi:hypothetical protein